MVARGIVAGLLAVGALALSPPAGAEAAAPAGSAPGVVEARGFVQGFPVTVRASSMLGDPKQPDHYNPANLLDLDDATVWAEGVPGNGEGQWLEVQTSNGSSIEGFEFMPGHGKSRALLEANARPRVVQFTYYSRSEQVGSLTIELPEHQVFGSWIINWQMPALADRIRATVKSTWSGTRYQDLCIARFRPIFFSSIRAPGQSASPSDELGTAVESMMGSLAAPTQFLAPSGQVTLREFAAGSSNLGPNATPKFERTSVGGRDDLDQWQCIGMATEKSWDRSGADLHGFLKVTPSGKPGIWTSSFLERPGRKSTIRPFEAQWENTTVGWKVRSADAKELTDEDEMDCDNP